jgi:hypothetical protein
MKRQVYVLTLLAAILFAGAAFWIHAAERSPLRLSDQEFWRLASDYSESDGTFHSENLVSNEALFQTIIPALTKTAIPGRAYLGVGSEQNFSYIAAVRPVIVFIVDIRRGNLDLHLTYKALFEMSTDRADFVSRLFSRKMPKGLSASSTAAEIFSAARKAAPDQALFDENLTKIKSHLMAKHGFRLSRGDLEGIDYVYGAWFKSGPDIRYELLGAGRGTRGGSSRLWGLPTYAELMTATDGAGRNLSYLATESAFRFLKDLESRNMLIPVVGNFGGTKALRAVGNYLKEHKMIVSAFYASNVEQYLHQYGIWEMFCANAAALPIDETSTLIRSTRGGPGGQQGFGGPTFSLDLVSIKPLVAHCAASVREP